MSTAPSGPPLTPGAGSNGAPPNGSGAPTWSAPLPTSPPVAPAGSPPTAPTTPTAPGRRRTPYVIGGVVVVAVVVVVALFALGGSKSKGKGESFGNASSPSPTLAPVQAFTPQSLNDALLHRPFPPNLLPAGFTFDPQRSPNGMLHTGRAFSDPAKDKEHHVVGTDVLSLSRAAPGQSFQITYLSFDDPANADAYLYDVRGLSPAPSPDQPICGVTSDGIVAGCSVRFENVVVEGRDGSTTGRPLADADAAAGVDLARSLNAAGVAFLKQVKQG
jgi:hypothetical protein